MLAMSNRQLLQLGSSSASHFLRQTQTQTFSIFLASPGGVQNSSFLSNSLHPKTSLLGMPAPIYICSPCLDKTSMRSMQSIKISSAGF